MDNRSKFFSEFTIDHTAPGGILRDAPEPKAKPEPITQVILSAGIGWLVRYSMHQLDVFDTKFRAWMEK